MITDRTLESQSYVQRVVAIWVCHPHLLKCYIPSPECIESKRYVIVRLAECYCICILAAAKVAVPEIQYTKIGCQTYYTICTKKDLTWNVAIQSKSESVVKRLVWLVWFKPGHFL